MKMLNNKIMDDGYVKWITNEEEKALKGFRSSGA